MTKGRISINSIEIEGLVDTGVDATIIALIMASRLASSGSKCSAFRAWQFVSSKTKCEIG